MDSNINNGLSNPNKLIQLIGNLDHEIPSIRKRALAGILEKIEHDIIPTEDLSHRIDLLNKLSFWFHSDTDEEDNYNSIAGLNDALKLVGILTKHEEFRENFLLSKTDYLLSNLRPNVNLDTKDQIDRILNSIGGLYIHCEGGGDSLNETACLPLTFSSARSGTGTTEKPTSSSKRYDQDIIWPLKKRAMELEFLPRDFDSLSEPFYSPPIAPRDHFQSNNTSRSNEGPLSARNNQNQKTPRPHFGIPKVVLEQTDRRVLSSTIESLLSKNESLVYVTVCFFRDVLINDFPVEVFLQESSTIISLIQVAGETNWQDEKINYAAFQALFKLSTQLRIRFEQLDSSDFYQNINPAQSSQSFYERSTNINNTDLLARNICEALRSILRPLIYDFSKVTLFLLLETYTFTLLKLIQLLPVDTKSLEMSLQEILLDLTHGYTKNSDKISPPLVSLIVSNILACLASSEIFILASDVRRLIRTLSSDPRLYKNAPDVFNYFVKSSTPFENNLEQFIEDMNNDNSTSSNFSSDRVIQQLYEVQNATEHRFVFKAIEDLWENICGLNLINRVKLDGECLEIEKVCKKAPWRDTFYRFLSVEPTSKSDEELLIKVLDVLNFVLGTMGDGNTKELAKWILPLCLDKGSAGLLMLAGSSKKNEEGNNSSSSCSPTMVQTIIFSWFELYNTIVTRNNMINETNSQKMLLDLFFTIVEILQDLSIDNYSASALSFCTFQNFAFLTSNPIILEKLKSNRGLTLKLLLQVSDALSSFCELTTYDSHRHWGCVYFASLSTLHLIIAMKSIEIEGGTLEWISGISHIIPSLLCSLDSNVLAIGFQITQILTATPDSLFNLLKGIESPALLWTQSYSNFIDPIAIPIVKEKAGLVLINLLKNWDEIRHTKLIRAHLPDWQPLNDCFKLITNICWESSLYRFSQKLNKLYKCDSNKEDPNLDINLTSFITQRVLSTVCFLLIQMNNKSTIDQFHPINFFHEITTSGICSSLFRILGTQKLLHEMEEKCFKESCSALASILQVLIFYSKLDRNISLILIGDRHNFSEMMKLFQVQSPVENPSKNTEEILAMLHINIFTLLTILFKDSGNNIEDLERNIWTNRKFFLPVMVNWLSGESKVKCRNVSLKFTRKFLSVLSAKSSQNPQDQHPVLCQLWVEKEISYGAAIANCLSNIYEDSMDQTEKTSVLNAISALFAISPSAKQYAIEQGLVAILLGKITNFASNFLDEIDRHLNLKRKTIFEWQEETFWILSVVTNLFYGSEDAKEAALFNNFSDTIHKIFRWWTMNLDRTLLHSFLEAFINFTDEFTKGSLSMIMTSNLIAVGPRKAPTPQSIFCEILDILSHELEQVEKNPNLKTINLIFALLKNCILSIECRNILSKTAFLNFMRRLHFNDIKKWGVKQNQVKKEYLEFLVHLSFFPEMQVQIAKVNEGIEILLLMLDLEITSISCLALQILRNLCFNPANRARFYCNEAFMPTISAKLRTSENMKELETAAVGLSALISNSEKGKLLAKKAECPRSISFAIQRLKKLEKTSNDVSEERQDLSSLIDLLVKTSSLIVNIDKNSGVAGSTNASELSLNTLVSTRS